MATRCRSIAARCAIGRRERSARADCSRPTSSRGELDEQRRAHRRGARRIHREHDGPHPRGGRAALRQRSTFPTTDTSFRDRHVLIVVRGDRPRRDLRALARLHPRRAPAHRRRRRRRRRGARGGAEARHHPRRHGLGQRRGAALRRRADRPRLSRRRARPGASGCVELGLEHTVVPAAGTSEDVAMLMAYEKGAALIVSVGAHFNLIEFLDTQARRHVLDLPHPPADRREAGRREGRQPALQPRARASRRWRCSSPPSLVLLVIVVITSPAPQRPLRAGLAEDQDLAPWAIAPATTRPRWSRSSSRSRSAS